MTRRTEFAIVAALTAVAAALRVPGLNSGLWFDEIVTVVESLRRPLSELITRFPPNSNNHPLYSLLATLAVIAFGEHPWSVRLPAFLFGVASVPALYWLGTAVATRTEAMLAALLLTCSYHAVWFSQNARGYTALLFFTIVTTSLFVRAMEESGPRAAAAYGAAMGLGLYTHLTMLFVAAAHGTVWIWRVTTAADARSRGRVFRIGAMFFGSAVLVCGLVYLPMAGEVYRLLTDPPPNASDRATPQWAFIELLAGLRIGFGTIGVAAALALAVVGTLSYWRQRPLVAALFVLPGVFAGVGLVAMHAPIRPRFILFLGGFGLLILVRGAIESGRWIQNRLARRTLRLDFVGVGAIVLMAAVSVWSLRFNYRFPKQDFDGAKAFVDAHRQAGEAVATAGLAVYPYKTYYGVAWTPVETGTEFETLRHSGGRAWVVYSFREYMDPAVVRQVERFCKPAQVFRGTLGGGDVVVCTIDGDPDDGQRDHS